MKIGSLRVLLITALVLATVALGAYTLQGMQTTDTVVSAAPVAEPTPAATPSNQGSNQGQNGPAEHRGPGAGIEGMKGLCGQAGPGGFMPEPGRAGGVNGFQGGPMQGPVIGWTGTITNSGKPGNRRGQNGQANPQQCANTALQNAQNQVNTLKTDQTFAQGKMDITLVNPLVERAGSLVQKASTANSSGNYTVTIAYAQAADQTAEAAHILMANALGNQLPSAQNSNRPNRPQAPAGQNQPNTQMQQAMVSRELANDYNAIKEAIGTTGQSGSPAGDTNLYVTTAEKLYTQAYNSYQAGNYQDAGKTAMAIRPLLGAIGSIFRASGFRPSPTPVTVPAPNF